MNKYNLINKVVMFTCESYIDMAREDGTNIPKELERLKRGILGQRMIKPFTHLEALIILELSKKDALTVLMDHEVSFIIFVFELMKVWTMSVDKKYRPMLGVSDKHFKIGGNYYWKQFMVAKVKDPEEYAVKKQIAKDSIEVAHQFFEWHWKELGIGEVK